MGSYGGGAEPSGKQRERDIAPENLRDTCSFRDLPKLRIGRPDQDPPLVDRDEGGHGAFFADDRDEPISG
jgi:hypothetical protein